MGERVYNDFIEIYDNLLSSVPQQRQQEMVGSVVLLFTMFEKMIYFKTNYWEIDLNIKTKKNFMD